MFHLFFITFLFLLPLDTIASVSYKLNIAACENAHHPDHGDDQQGAPQRRR